MVEIVGCVDGPRRWAGGVIFPGRGGASTAKGGPLPVDTLLVQGTGRIQRTLSFPHLGIGEKALARRAYFGGEHLELGDQVTRSEVSEEDLVGLGVVVGALDEDTFE